MKIEWIECLDQVRVMGSFTAVARSRGVTPMAISKQIAALENEFGQALIQRSRRGASLTEAGWQLLERSAGLLRERQQLQNWLEDRHGEPSGTLKVLCLESELVNLTLTPWMGEFMRRYPKLTVQVILAPHFHEIDIDQADIYWAFGKYLGHVHPGLKQKRLLQTRFGIYASTNYLAEYGLPETPEDLDRHWMIGNNNNQPVNFLVVDTGAGPVTEGFDGCQVPYRVTTATGAMELAEQGLGITNMAESLFTSTYRRRFPTMTPILEAYWHDGLDAFAYYHHVTYEQPKVRAFLDFFSDRIVEWAQ